MGSLVVVKLDELIDFLLHDQEVFSFVLSPPQALFSKRTIERFNVGLLILFSLAGFFINKVHTKGLILGFLCGFIVLIFIYVIHEITKNK